MMTEPLAKFTGQLHKLQTLTEGGGRVALDFPASEMSKLYKLLEAADQPGLLLQITIEQLDIDPRFYGVPS